MTLTNKLADHDFVNWVKAGLVLQFTKEGIEGLVSTVTNQFHQTIVTSLPGGITCTACTTENVLPCPTNGLCGGRGCRYHSILSPTNCTSCEHVRNEVFNKHRFRNNNAPLRFGGPSWRNTDATRWSTNAWELAKCYMARDGYSNVTSVKDTDLPGLLSVIINHTDFQTVLKENISLDKNIFCKARQIRNDILHSPTQKVTDADLKMYINTMLTLLSDPVKLVHDSKAKGAISELQKVETGSLSITDQDINQVKSEARKALEEFKFDAIEDFKNQVKTHTEEKVKQIQQKTEASKDQVEAKTAEGKRTLQETTERSKNQIKAKTEESKQTLQGNTKTSTDQLEIKAREGKRTLQEVTKVSKDQIFVKIKKAKRELQEEIKTSTDQISTNIKKANKSLQEKTKSSKNKIEAKTNEGKIALQLKTKSSKMQIDEGTEECKSTLQKNTEKSKDEIEANTEESKQTLQEKTESSIDQLDVKAGEGKRSFQKLMTKSKKQIRTKIKKAKRTLHEKTEAFKDQIETKTDECKISLQEDAAIAMQSIQQTSCPCSERKIQYENVKSELKRKLIEIYKARHLSTPLIPSNTEVEVNIAETYVQPHMVIELKQIRNTSKTKVFNKIDNNRDKEDNKKNNFKIESYKEIFQKDPEDEDLCENVYISGDAGSGKTSLCKRMVSTWCDVHSTNKKLEKKVEQEKSKVQNPLAMFEIMGEEMSIPSPEFDCSYWNVHDIKTKVKKTTEENLTTMTKFSFLFYVSLRDCTSEEGVEKMIKSILPKKYHGILAEVLDDEEEQCLIILDGLDEWTSPKPHKIIPSITKGLPNREVWSKCSILTTTRPWKLAHLGLKSSEIDRQISILGIDYDSYEMLTENIVALLNTEYNRTKIAYDFKKMLMEKNMEAMRYVPVLLKQIICLWHDGKSIESLCEIYSGMLELLFDIAESRLQKIDFYTDMQAKTSSTQQLPKCFFNTTKCQNQLGLILSVSKLAFFTIFNNNHCSSLVFKKSIARYHGMSQTEMEICLKAGLLSQSRHTDMCTEQNVKVSFLHKTFQEFLAALYISMSSTSTEDPVVDRIIQTCDSVYKVLEMSKVFVFVAGMSPRMVKIISEHICTVASADKDIQKYRDDIIVAEHKFWMSKSNGCLLEELIYNCFEESEQNGHMGVTLQMQYMILGVDPPPNQIGKYSKYIYNLKSLTVTKYLGAVNYGVVRPDPFQPIQNSSGSLTVIHLKDFTMGSITTKQFSNLLHSLLCLLSVQFDAVKMTPGQYQCLINFLSQQTQMKHIQLVRCDIDDINDDDMTINSYDDSSSDIDYSDNSTSYIGQKNTQELSHQTEILTVRTDCDGDNSNDVETHSGRSQCIQYRRQWCLHDLSYHSQLHTLCITEDCIHTCTPRVNTQKMEKYECDCSCSLYSIKGALKLKTLT